MVPAIGGKPLIQIGRLMGLIGVQAHPLSNRLSRSQLSNVVVKDSALRGGSRGAAPVSVHDTGRLMFRFLGRL
jgi:hypothetical protein